MLSAYQYLVPAQAWTSPPTRTAANEALIFRQFSDDLFSRHPQNTTV